ncbi:MAG: carboxypeptidase-like regulatory domain-containing protein [Lacipirellulaceae bacterium]
MFLGCSDSKFEYAPVTGSVKLDGQPVSGARVVFMPQASGDSREAGPYSNGETDEQGNFQLSSVATDPREGAVVGNHRIVISTRKTHLDPENRDIEIVDSPETIPRPYTNYQKTPLTFEVSTDGKNEANFDLDGELGKRPKNRR